MNIDNFVKNFASQFEETPIEKFKADTNFREIEEWNSLIALSIIAMVDEEYDAKLTGDDIRNSVTIADIFEKVKTKKT